MFNRTLAQLQAKEKEADAKLNHLNNQKHKAIQDRIKELQSSAYGASTERVSQSEIESTRRQFELFKQRNRALYKRIYQGTRQLDLRKKELIAVIQGGDLQDQYN